MTEEVVSHGAERPGPGRAVGVAVTLALVALVGLALTRAPEERATPPPPRPSLGPPATPPATPSGGLPPDHDSWFARKVTVPRPPPGVLRAVLLVDGVPGFLVPGDDLPYALDAVGGPPHAPVLVGWCARQRTFQDAAGKHFYDEHGNSLAPGESLGRYLVRRNPSDPSRIDVSADAQHVRSDAGPAAVRCAEPLYYPPLPRRAKRVHDTVRGHRVVAGRYVLTTESRAFCAATSDPECMAEGWEQYGAGLPPGDLAGSYTWEGDFVVRGSSGGALRVIRLPGVRLVRTERVGARSRVGTVAGVRREGGAFVLDFEANRQVEEYAFRADAELLLGRGYTGLGRARATPRTLARFLADEGNAAKRFHLVLDARDRVLRLVVSQGP